jgi:uncharacterized iron-regulated protein
MKDNFDIHKWNLERYLNESQEREQTNENQERKQTAVDWLIGKLNKPGFAQVVTDEEIKQSKEIEKEQHLNTYLEGDKMEGRASLDDAEQYYNETYGK